MSGYVYTAEDRRVVDLAERAVAAWLAEMDEQGNDVARRLLAFPEALQLLSLAYMSGYVAGRYEANT